MCTAGQEKERFNQVQNLEWMVSSKDGLVKMLAFFLNDGLNFSRVRLAFESEVPFTTHLVRLVDWAFSTLNFTEELRELPSLESELLPLLSSEEKSLESRLERFEARLESWLESER